MYSLPGVTLYDCDAYMQQAFVGLEATSLVVLDRDYETGEWCRAPY